MKWVEFPAGPQLLEGLNVGAVDVGYVGEAPPIFAQAAGAQVRLHRLRPGGAAAPRRSWSPKDSPIKSVAELKGKKVALNKGSNVHYLLVKQLEKNGLKFSDIQPVYLAPADAPRRLRKQERRRLGDLGSVPGRGRKGHRRARAGRRHAGVVNNYQFYLGERGFVAKNPKVIEALFDDSVEQGIWLKKNLRQAAELIAPLQGLPVDVVELGAAPL